MKTKLVRIGNSRGVRLAKAFIEEAGLTDEVEIRAQPGAVIITALNVPRAGWAEAASKYGPAALLDEPTATQFDDEEWEWR